MINLSKLRHEHSALLDIVAKLRQLIGRASPPPQLHLFASTELTTALMSLKSKTGALRPCWQART